MTAVLSAEAQHVVDLAHESAIAYLDLQFTDVTGLIKTVTIATRQLEVALTQGVWFDGSAIEGFARVAELDMYLRPDPATFAVIPWETDRRIGRLLCNVYTPTGEPFPGDPRGVLQRAVAHATEMDFRYCLMPELEFYLFRQPLDLHSPVADDQAGYFDLSATETRTVRRAISDALESMGITVESGHHEVGNGQHEIDLTALDALAMADAIMTARLAVRSIASAHGLLATFMPKPLARMAGSGMHVHQQLRASHSGANLFSDPESDYGLSRTGRAFMAGQLTHARGMCAVLAPLVNSYKRLVAGHEAPVYVTWAQLNRSALVRVPRVHPDQPELDPDRTARARSKLQSVSGLCGDDPRRAGWHHAQPGTAHCRRGRTPFAQRTAATAADTARLAQRSARSNGTFGFSRRCAWAARLRTLFGSETHRVG